MNIVYMCVCVCIFALLAYFRHKLHSDRIDSARPRPCHIIQFRSHYLREKLWRSVHSLTQTLIQINTAAHFFSANTNTVMHTQTRAQSQKRGCFIYSCSWYTSGSEGCGTDSIMHEPAEEVMHGEGRGCYLKMSVREGRMTLMGHFTHNASLNRSPSLYWELNDTLDANY